MNIDYREKSSEMISFVIWIIVIALLLVVAIYRPINKASSQREVIATVTDKVVKNSNDISKYLVFTEDKSGNVETYEITDSFFMGRFDSSDVWANIKIGSTYKFTVAGSRNGFMSWYPNIYEYKLFE